MYNIKKKDGYKDTHGDGMRDRRERERGMERSVCHDIYRMSDNVIPIVHNPLRACSRF